MLLLGVNLCREKEIVPVFSRIPCYTKEKKCNLIIFAEWHEPVLLSFPHSIVIYAKTWTLHKIVFF